MEKTLFEFINFAPRTGVISAAEHLSKEITEALPKGSKFKGIIKQDKNGFHFSIVLLSGAATLNSDNYVKITESPSRGRHWVIPVLNQMAYDIINQAITWNLTKENFDMAS